ncbi:ExeM/NucH family extracellular endonuclease [Herbiconiux sp.]|uniref:ExeM/NucH family extracellular endonuclease n=1 Tax=Herbiconiux sp. TaxID=1871186 RepID=UPI0025C4731D|nr:ExeM/NucH family extracellular endonuclease [Herbiconiux sp.]
MSKSPTRTVKAALASVLGGALIAAPLVGVVSSASASVDGTGVVINEVYSKGGSANAPFNKKFVELYNPGDSAVSLDGWSLQYRSSGGTAVANGVAPLSGSIAPDSYFLAQINGNGEVGAALPTPDIDLGGALNPSGTNGTLYLASTTTALTLPVGAVATGTEGVVDLIGFGTSNTFEGAVVATVGANGVPNSLNRTGFADSDNNAADFVTSDAVTPQSSGTGEPEPTPTPTPTDTPEPTPTPTETPAPGTTTAIPDIQGPGSASPIVGQTVSALGVVTAAYGTGGFNGYYIQAPGTGGAIDFATHTTSDAIFVYSPSTAASVQVGDYVSVTGAVSEYFDLTQITVTNAAGLQKLDASTVEAPTPAVVELPADATQRESLEGMLVAPQGGFTVSNTYSTNQYAEIGLAAGDSPLITPTEIARPGSAEYDAAVADNAARAVTLDDGATTNFLSNANKGIALPFLTQNPAITVGSSVAFTAPVILDYRNSAWKFQPTTQLTAEGALPATFTDVRQPQPEDVGGQVAIASFNVLNYFTTTGDQLTGCTYYTDRAGNPITVNRGCDARGAANAENLARQQAKIVAAITGLGADVVALEEIENSARFGDDRDAALGTLVGALNTAEGAEEWAFVPSPDASSLPASEDVIRTAFIYKKAAVEPVGASHVLVDTAFSNARAPLAQEFKAAGGSDDETFIAIVNHLKSKGDSDPPATGDNANGIQGAFNGDRTRQAAALLEFAEGLQTELGTTDVFLIGDFNSYTQEDPSVAIQEAGYVDQGSKTGSYTYSFSGQSGSLDHVYASASADAKVTGADVWNINSGESIAKEYSRFNYNLTDFYSPDVYRSSDHDPVIVGYDFAAAAEPVDINLIDINDFHGRIDANTVKFAGTVEQLKAENENSLFISSGDNIGASLFASATQDDQPTIDVLNALGLTSSAVGNHEFDKGYADLTDRVIGADDDRNAEWDYLGANVYLKGTTTPALDEYTIREVDGLRVAIVGAITEETPTLVSPAGVAGLDFGDPVEAVNRVTAALTDGDESNGEADVIIASYHEGAGAGIVEGSTFEEELAEGGVFADIVNETSPEVAAIFTGHTHKQYAWDAPIPGTDATRPVLQTGNYGEFVGQVVLTVDGETGDLESYTARNVARTTTADADLVAAYPAVAEVKTITDAALAVAAEIGNQPKGSVTADITTAFNGGSYVDGKYTGGARDNRAAESTLGNLVADSLVSSLGSPERGGATIGVVNPGGLRAELLFAASTAGNPANTDGVITYAEANAVLPFVNNLWTTSLTGAQFKTVLEQQWQTDAAGNVPSRPFLKLGLSDNVEYTFDPARAAGDRVTGIWIDDAPLDPDASYRIGSFNFLLQGGDNFREFAKGSDTRDSGLVDRDAWISYLEANPGLTPEFDRKAVQVTDVTTDELELGAEFSATVSGLDLTSLGSPLNTSLTATWTGSAATFEPIAVTAGTAEVTLTVPADAPYGAGEIVLTAQPSGTEVRIPVTVAAPELQDINLIDINDFHGRIDGNTVEFAGTVEQLRAAHGEENTLFVSAGDNIGASLFASSAAQDQPTIDVLNALGLTASAVGNHEFDQGYADLRDRVIGAEGARNAEWDYLGANVYLKGTTTPALDEYSLQQVGDLTVAVIGAVTEESPTLVSPAGVAGLEFGDPVEAVNRVTATLTDGDQSNGEADVVIATYHEGAGAGIVEGSTVEEELAAGGVFAKIVNETSPGVAAIFTGHTHKQYSWDAPVPGIEGKTRPVLQTGNYGENIGNVVLSADPATGEVMSYTAQNVARTTVAETELVSTYPRVAEVKQITDAALAAAALIGNQPKGSVTADITTAYTGGSFVDGKYTGGTRDDRASESALGNLIADSLVSSLSSEERGGAEIGVVNPGGIRAELLFKGDTTINPANTDGVITYAEANAVLPFVNNLWTTSLTGAQFKTVLEQQWQTDAAGNVPSRPFLKLGLSDNVEYTFDPARAAGDRVTGIWIDDAPLDPDASYRIGSFNFLLQGGDNFREFAKGSDTRDSGLVDRDAWISYLEANPGLTPEFDRKAVTVTNTPAAPVELGSTVTFDVSGLDLTSQGSPQNTTLTASWTGSAATFEPITVTNGAASVSLTVPADAFAASEIVLTAAPSGTSVIVPVQVLNGLPPVPEEPTIPPVTVPEESLPEDVKGDISIGVDVTKPGATVKVFVGVEHANEWVSVVMFSEPRQLGGWQLVAPDGTVEVTIPQDAASGAHKIAALTETGEVLGWVEFEVTDLGIEVDRIGGADRYEVAVNTSKEGFPEGADTVYLSSGQVFPDALSAAPAAALADGPILLTTAATVPATVRAEIERLDPTNIVIVGGTSSVSNRVVIELAALGKVSRIGGADRYEASRNVAARTFPDGADVAVLATGSTFADALSAGAAVDGAGPVILVKGTAGQLDEATTLLLEELDVSEIVIAGGPASVSPGIASDAGKIATTVRLGGADRYEASRSINAHFFESADRVLLATGQKFADALTGSAFGPRIDAPLFTTRGDCVPVETLDAILELGATRVTLLGGPASLTVAVEDLTTCGVG